MTNEAKELLKREPELCKEIATKYCQWWLFQEEESDSFEQWSYTHLKGRGTQVSVMDELKKFYQ